MLKRRAEKKLICFLRERELSWVYATNKQAFSIAFFVKPNLHKFIAYIKMLSRIIQDVKLSLHIQFPHAFTALRCDFL